jgi:hypothetical protein
MFGSVKSQFHFTGVDDTGCVYVAKGTGRPELSGSPAIGYFSLTHSIEDHPAVCEWPIGRGREVESLIMGVGGAIGIKLTLSTAYGRAGDFRDEDYLSNMNTVGGFNLFVGITFLITSVDRITYSITAPG